MTPPPSSLSSSSSWLQHLRHSNTASASSSRASVSSSSRRLSLQEVDEIDSWLARLHRLEGILPLRESLPAALAAAARRPPTIARSASSPQQDSSNNSGANTGYNTPSPSQHTRRHSLALLATATTTTATTLSDHLDHHYSRPATSTGTHTAVDSIVDPSPSPRPVAPSLHTSILTQSRTSSPAAGSTRAATITARDTTQDKESKVSEDNPGFKIDEKRYREESDGSYILLSEVIAESEEGESRIADENTPLAETAETSNITHLPRSGSGYLGVSEETHNCELKTRERSSTLTQGSIHSRLEDFSSANASSIDIRLEHQGIVLGSSRINNQARNSKEQIEIMSSSLSEAFNPTSTISSSRSVNSFSTTSSGGNQIGNSNGNGNNTSCSGKLQPRSPLASPRTTLSLRKGRKNFPLQHRASDVSDGEDEVPNDASSNMAGEITTDAQSDNANERLPESSIGPLSRAKKLSKSSFTSSIDSVRGSIIASSSSLNNSNNEKHNRRESNDSKTSSNSHSLPYLNIFTRNSQKHPQSYTSPQHHSHQHNNSPATTSTSAPFPKLVARDERAVLTRDWTRPRLTSARSTSSLQLIGSSDRQFMMKDKVEEGDSEIKDENLHNTRRASSSSISTSFKRSKDDRRALLASSNHRISLAPPLMRSYSYDSRMIEATLAASSITPLIGYDPKELAKHVPELKENILIWIPFNEHNGSNLNYQSTGYTGASISKSSSNHPSHNHNSLASKGLLSNTFFSNVPMVNARKKIVRRESTQLLFSDSIAGENQEHHQHPFAKQRRRSQRDQYGHGGDEKKDKEKNKNKSKDNKALILLPAGQWKKGEAVLKSNGQLVISSGTICLASIQLTALQRTDIRPVDPSLLGKQRCVSLHVKNGPNIQPPSHTTTHERRMPSSSSMTPSSPSTNFPISPSAPDFFSFSTSSSMRASSSSTASSVTTGALEDPLLLNEGGQTLFLALSTTALQHAWIASLLCHAQPEVWPKSAASKPQVSFAEEEGSSEMSQEEDDILPKSPRARPQFTQHSSWRQDGSAEPTSDCPIRMYRSISLQVIQARCSREHQNPSLSQSLAALAMNSIPTTPSSADIIHSQKRSGSITSLVTNETSSSVDISSQPEHTSGTIPPSHYFRPTTTAHQNASIPGAGKKTEHNSKEHKKEERVDLFCEIWLDGEILGRTGIRHLGAKTIWEELFHFSNLGPYNHSLDIHVFTIRKHHVQLAGKVALPLPTIQRNKPIEGWFEMQPPEHAMKKGHVDSLGELNLRVLVKEDVALPYKAYTSLGSMLAEDTESKAVSSLLDTLQIELDTFAHLLLRIDTAHRRVLQRIMSLCEMEVESNDNIATLFRGNTLLTKTVEMHMRLVGSDYLDGSVGQVLRKICEERIAIEIDPSRLDHKHSLQDNISAPEEWSEAVWSSIYNSRHSCPIEVRRGLRKIRQIVDRHCSIEVECGRLSEEDRNRARFTSVSAFISLRLFCPAILRPNLFHLCPSHPPDAKTSRTLTLVAKVLMGMANMQTFGSKEPWMAAMNPFLQRNASSYQDFITYLCSKEEGAKSDWTEKDFEPYKIPILKRMTLTPDIVREGVPELPFLNDLPKDYAAFATLVATAEPIKSHSRTSDDASEGLETDNTLPSELLKVCQSLHGQARSRVRALARSGDLSAPGGEYTRRMFARTEQVRLSTRFRGNTVSKTMSTPSPDRTTVLSKSSPAGSTEETRAALYTSSPASTASGNGGSRLASLSASTSPSMDSSSDSQLSSSPLRPKRRSYTVSASPAMSLLSTSPTIVSSSMLSRPLPAPPVEEEDDADEILEIRNPSSPGQPIKELNPRRLTIIAPPPLDLNSTSQLQRHPLPGNKTPRAPTFTQEQRENMKELQDAFTVSAFDNPASAIGVMPNARYEPPLSPSAVSSPPPKRKLFRKK